MNSAKNFLKQLNDTTSFKRKIDLCNNTLQKIGVGSSRVVYDFGDNKVLKVAKNRKGIAQNNAECDIYFSSKNDLLNIIYDCADDDSYVIAEKANKINERKFIQLLNVPSITNMRELIAIVGKWYYDVFRKTLFYGKPTLTDEDHELIDELSDEGGFLYDLHDLVGNYNFNPSDMFRIANIGSIIHDGQEQLVLIDYGFTDNTAQLYRKKINEANTVSEVSLSLINEIPKGNTYHDKYTPSYYNELKKDIQLNGIKEPITLKYYYETNTLELGEGHHRLQIANELNLKTIPVQVKVIYEGKINKAYLKSSDKNKPFQAPIKLDIEKYEKRNYFPTYINPSEIGLIQNLNENKKLKLVIESLVKKELRKVLNEGASDILYHFTWSYKLYNILKADTFYLTPSVRENPDFNYNKGKFYYMSTTRSKMSGFKYGNVKLVLDGRKLKQNYKIVPVDYWGWGPERFEQEDRIISNNDTINNFSKYILEIHTYGLEDWYGLKELINLIKDSNIQFFYYDNEKDFLKQKNNIDINNIKINNKKDEYNYISNKELDYYDYRFACLLCYKNEKIFNQIKNFILNNNHSLETFIDSCNQFNINYNSTLNYISDDFDNIERFAADFNNMKNYDTDKTKQNFNRFIIKLFMDDLKINKINSFKDYFNHKRLIGRKKFEYFKGKLIEYIITEKQKNMNEDILYDFKNYMTINGFEYNHGYESEDLLSVFNKYFTIVTELFKKEILLSKDLSTDIMYISYRIEQKVDIKKLELSNELTITDSYNDYHYYNQNFKYIINDLINKNNSIEKKAKELQDEYDKQFYNN